MAQIPPAQKDENASMHLHEVLAAEFAALHDEPLPAGSSAAVLLRKDLEAEEARRIQEEEQQRHLKDIWAAVHQLPEKRAALCISGGGIRSAAFTLGVLQGLARSGLLGKFHYLSTVAGAGFIGGWLTAWIQRANGGLDEVLTDLSQTRLDQGLNPEPAEVRNLRNYTNYFSPRLGLLSTETWTLITTYLRNLVLNWLVLIPLLAAVLSIPWMYVAILMKSPPPHTFAPLWLGGICLAIGVAYMGLNLPTTRKSTEKEGKREKKGRDEKSFLLFCLFPLFLGGVFMTIHWAWFTNYGGKTPAWPLLPGMKGVHTLSPFLWFGVVAHLVTWIVSLRRRFHPLEFLAVAASGAIGGTLLWVVAIKLFPQPLAVAELYCCFAIPLFFGLFVVAINVFTGLSSRWTGDPDREWWTKASGWFLVTSVVWVLISLLLFFGTLLLSWGSSTITKLTLGSIAGALTLLASRSSLFLADLKKRDITGQLMRILAETSALAALLFITAMLMNLMIRIVTIICSTLGVIWNLDTVSYVLGKKNESINVILYTPSWVITGVAYGLALFGLAMAFVVNTNTLSLHAMFRRRLIRTYLGAANKHRNPNPFTGFDDHDNPRMAKVWPKEKFGGKLMPVINIALNLVHGSKVASQETKTASFTVSPLHCGSHLVGYRKTDATQGQRDGSEEDTSGADAAPKVSYQPKGPLYGGEEGISLGTAITISGAVPRSTKGHHSSPLVRLFLTLLNFRLGVWLGNPGPAGDKTFQLGYPASSVRPIIAEAFGLTDGSNPYVYLSDARHFDSLGLYEMVMRRCHYIVVSDAGADPDFTFNSLAEAIRKIRFDFGIPIEFAEIKLYPRGDDDEPRADRQHCAIGRIRYAVVDGPAAQDGVLIYVKPVCYGDEPLDVYEYSQTSKSFPHESAGDQFFTESRLESYRALGAHIMRRLCENRCDDFPEFIRNIEGGDLAEPAT